MRTNAIMFLAALTVSACGGGSGSSPSAAGSPAPAPAPPPVPPGIDSTKVSLAQLPPGPCPIGQQCGFLDVHADVDAAGELTVLWSEVPTGGTNRLAAANVAAGGTTALSSGAIESGFAVPMAHDFVARPLGNRRFAIFHRYGPNLIPASEPTRARVVDMATSGSPTVAPAVQLPSYLQSTVWPISLFQDSTRQLYAFASGVAPPFPAVQLGAGASLQTTALTSAPMSQVISSRAADFPQSAASRVVWGIHGQELPNDQPGVYFADQNLQTGAVLPPFKVSTQPVVMSNGQRNCITQSGELEAQTWVGTAVLYVVPWRQLNAAGDSCDLYVNGQRANSGSMHVVTFAVSLQPDGSVVAVWNEVNNAAPAGSFRVLWSRRDASGTTWSTPAPIAPQFSPATVEQRLGTTARHPSGPLAVVWSSSGMVGSFISKFQDGVWTTVRVTGAALSPDIRAVAINGSGQGAAVSRGTVTCGGTTACDELAAFRF